MFFFFLLFKHCILFCYGYNSLWMHWQQRFQPQSLSHTGRANNLQGNIRSNEHNMNLKTDFYFLFMVEQRRQSGREYLVEVQVFTGWLIYQFQMKFFPTNEGPRAGAQPVYFQLQVGNINRTSKVLRKLLQASLIPSL